MRHGSCSYSIATGALIILAGMASAGDYEITRHTIDGGGAPTTGGDWVLTGTVGQPDATTTTLTGGDFALVGGFWTGRVTGPHVPGDFDGDGDVDLDDYALFPACVTGPGGGVPPGCEDADFELDNDVDFGDFGVFQLAFTGAP